jgi:ABC-type lipopolysaccharide export system ATPase subunit
MCNILEIDSIQKNYGHKSVLSNVFLQCRTGEIIGILGRNGSGKSTLLQIVSGLISADFKRTTINKLLKNTNSKICQDISYLSQDNFIPKHFSVKTAIQLSIDKNNIQTFLEDNLINSIIDNKINQLSGGELRYLEIKLVLENNKKFALLDEPYNGLSPVAIEKINTLILQNKAKKGIIITDHNYKNVIEISTDLYLMKAGALSKIKSTEDLVFHGYLNSIL